jgi:RNA polymerase sigma factor (sigma-70 family)
MKLDCQASIHLDEYDKLQHDYAYSTLDIDSVFWQFWQQNQDYLYFCCIKWMGGNYIEAEDALSRAMLKAWEKVKKYTGEILNIKAWLTRLTHNLCIDIHRERSRDANRVENIEVIPEEKRLLFWDDMTESALETEEKKIVIRKAIDNLPNRLRETFILYFDQELSYQEIVQQQNISYQNVCKRISHARAILREELRGYFIDSDRTDLKLLVIPTSEVKENGGFQTIESETLTLSEEVEIAVSELPQQVKVSEQQINSDPIGVTFNEKLEINKDCDYCTKQNPKTLALVSSNQKTQSYRNSLLKVLKIQQKPLLEKVGREFLLPSRSPPGYSFLYFQSCSRVCKVRQIIFSSKNSEIAI